MFNIDILLKDLEEFERAIDYRFKNKKNILLALSHSSFANECKDEKIKSNERLEFLGDAILNTVISEWIYTKFPHLSEGEMTKARASIVCEPSLTKCANKIEVGKHLLLGKGEELTGGRDRTSILSDAYEALIGAIYIDGGMTNAKKFIHNQMKDLVEDPTNDITFMDYKTHLQELVQKNSEDKIVYQIIKEEGPDHNKLFVSQVKIGEEIMGTGEGKSKKEAEQNAARASIKRWL